LLRDGGDPSHERKVEKLRISHQSENTFEVIAREWHGKQSAAWVMARAFAAIDHGIVRRYAGTITLAPGTFKEVCGSR